MIRWIWGSDDNVLNDALAEWCATKIGLTRPLQRPCVAFGVFNGDRLIAVAVFNNYCPEAGVIEIHAAADSARWLTRRTLYELFSYAFDRAGCQMMVARVSEYNARTLRIFRAYGFDEVIVPRLRGRDEAEVIFHLTDDAWRRNGFHHKDKLDGQKLSAACA